MKTNHLLVPPSFPVPRRVSLCSAVVKISVLVRETCQWKRRWDGVMYGSRVHGSDAVGLVRVAQKKTSKE